MLLSVCRHYRHEVYMREAIGDNKAGALPVKVLSLGDSSSWTAIIPRWSTWTHNCQCKNGIRNSLQSAVFEIEHWTQTRLPIIQISRSSCLSLKCTTEPRWFQIRICYLCLDAETSPKPTSLFLPTGWASRTYQTLGKGTSRLGIFIDLSELKTLPRSD